MHPFMHLVAPCLIRMKLAWTLQAFTPLLFSVPPVAVVEPSCPIQSWQMNCFEGQLLDPMKSEAGMEVLLAHSKSAYVTTAASEHCEQSTGKGRMQIT